jgi:lipoprotein NlpI
MAGKSTNSIVSLLFTAASFTTGILWLHSVAAEGALAIGMPRDVAKSGFAAGFSYNAKTEEAARQTALDYCKKATAPEKTRSLCKVIETFSDRCVALSMDPKVGTPGAGWGIGDNLRSAQRAALSKCETTAGPARRAACVVTQSNCDGMANAGYRCEKLNGDTAIAACDEAIRQDPQSAANFNNRGFEYRNKGESDRALTDFNKAVELNPRYAMAYNNRANVYRDRGDSSRALADYSKAIELSPKYDLAYFNRGLTYLYGGDADRALADINQASELDPKDAFYALWVDIVNKRSNLRSRLAEATAQLDMTKWPAPVIRLFLGQMTPGAALAAADDPDADLRRRRVCDANFFLGELALQQGTKEEASRLFRIAATDCPRGRGAWAGANGELKALGITP